MTAPVQQLKLSRIGQVGIMVKNLEEATAFYRDKLGMQHLFTAAGMAFFDLGGVRLMLGQASHTDQSHAPTFLYYVVDDIHGAFQTLKDRGVTPFEEPEMAYRAGGVELWLAIVKDMDNNMVALMQEKKVA